MAVPTVCVTISTISGEVVYSERVRRDMRILDVLAELATRMQWDKALLQLVDGDRNVSAGWKDDFDEDGLADEVCWTCVRLVKPATWDDVSYCDACDQWRYVHFGYAARFFSHDQIDWTPVTARCNECGGRYTRSSSSANDPHDSDEMSVDVE